MSDIQTPVVVAVPDVPEEEKKSRFTRQNVTRALAGAATAAAAIGAVVFVAKKHDSDFPSEPQDMPTLEVFDQS